MSNIHRNQSSYTTQYLLTDLPYLERPKAFYRFELVFTRGIASKLNFQFFFWGSASFVAIVFSLLSLVLQSQNPTGHVPSIYLGLIATLCIGLTLATYQLRKRIRTGIGFALLEKKVYSLERSSDTLGNIGDICAIVISCKHHRFFKGQYATGARFQHKAYLLWKNGKKHNLGSSEVQRNREESWNQLLSILNPLCQGIRVPLVSPSSDSLLIYDYRPLEYPDHIKWISAEQKVTQLVTLARWLLVGIILFLSTLIILALSQ